MRWLRHAWPVILWAAAIWIFSTDWFSEAHTSHFIVPFLHWMLPRASEDTIEIIHLLIRKSAHITEYFVFSLLTLEAIRGDRRGWNWRWGITAIVIAAVYAATDEFHQEFVPTRGPSVIDAMIDTLGAAIAQFAMAWWTLRRNRRSAGNPALTPARRPMKDRGAASTP
jgi:VanZ family protein